jgi:hypothetical protein
VIFIGELMKQAERYLAEGVHPRVLCDGFDVAQKESAAFLEDFKARRRPAPPTCPRPAPAPSLAPAAALPTALGRRDVRAMLGGAQRAQARRRPLTATPAGLRRRGRGRSTARL